MILSTQRIDNFIIEEQNGLESISIGSTGQRHLNEQLLSEKDVDLDLNEGSEFWVDKDRSLKRLGVLFEYLIKKSPEGDLEKILNGAKFVTRRGVLTNMAMGRNLLKHKGLGDWQIVCERRKGVIFLEEEMLPEESARRANLTDEQNLCIYWGHRFAEYMVTNDNNELSNNLRNLSTQNSPPELRMAMLASLGDECDPSNHIKLMYSGDVSAVDSDGKYVEIKTTKHEDPGSNYWFKNDKSVRWWIQSRLVEVSYVVLGTRDDQGYVRKLEKMTLDQLYGLQTLQCNGRKCLRFLRDTLVTIEEALKEGEAMRVTCTGGNLTMVKIGTEEAGILTQKFIDHFKL